METALIEALAPYGPVALIGGLVLVLLRKELAKALFSGRDETAIEKLLQEQTRMFQVNMDLFRETNKHFTALLHDSEAIRDTAKEHLGVTRAILNEHLRNGKH